jgi:hypothetical protein
VCIDFSNTISFTGLCKEYGFSTNPLKKAVKGEVGTLMVLKGSIL